MTANSSPGDKSRFQVFQCTGEDTGWQEWPGFGGLSTEVEKPYFQATGTSYRMNNLAYSDGKTAGIYARPITRIPETSKTLAFFEARCYQSLWTNEVTGTLPPGELTGYHKRLGLFNVAYSDAHVSFSDFGKGTYYPHAAGHDGRDARGTWGRMDTLPEPLLDPHGEGAGLLTPPPTQN